MPPTQKKASILRSLTALTEFGDAEPLALHVLVLVEARGLDDPKRHHLGGTARRSRGDALALEVRHGLDAGAVDGHDMHAVRVDHQQRLQRHLAALELVLALQRIERGIGHRERHLALTRRDQFEIVDRSAGDLRGGLHVRQVLRQHVGHGAAERIIDAAGAAGADRHRLLLGVNHSGECEPRREGDGQRRRGSFCFCHHVVHSLIELSREGRPFWRRRSGLPQQHAETDDQARHISVADVAPGDQLDNRLDQAGEHQQQSG